MIHNAPLDYFVHGLANRTYYLLKPILLRTIQIALRRYVTLKRRERFSSVWPIDIRAAEPPENWNGWPGGKQFALVLTHDVDTCKGLQRCNQLMEIDLRHGIKSSFNFVPERYHTPDALRQELGEKGFEIGVHGLKHDGKLFSSRKIFEERAIRINFYLSKWQASGFRAPSMHHNLQWMHKLNIIYDSSTFDTDPFEPQSDGVMTIFPFWVEGRTSQRGYLELPYTLPQDFTLFILLRETDIRIWRNKVDWIAEKGGMALLNTHPDYMKLDGGRKGTDEYPVKYYEDFLEYVISKYRDKIWQVLPRELAQYRISEMIRQQGSLNVKKGHPW